MDKDILLKLLQSVAAGNTPAVDAARQLRHLSVEDVGFAHIDHHRSLRKGFPEVIFGEGKTAEQIIGIMERMGAQEHVILATRIDPVKAQAVLSRIPQARYDPAARMIVWEIAPRSIQGRGTILIISAGTSDIPVAMEASLTAQAMGNRVETVFDVGVAGIHRLFQHRERIESAMVLIVVAGMVSRPVIAVPTSVGYGVSLGGLTALFAMLNSCSSNVAVVNIDNGFGAGYMAAMINRN
jgi:NCAIR mutase (PurE)-related protein